MERIDKVISKELNIARSEAKAIIKSGRVFLNGNAVTAFDKKINETRDLLEIDGKEIKFRRFVYIMMNKPTGVISSSDGRKTNEKTVIDILPDNMKRKNLFPAGRLDKDTTGFLLITDDGNFAHDILSPKKHVAKTYIAGLDKPFNDDIIKNFKQGVQIGENECMPALLEAIDGDYLSAKIVLKQGMYHQIKRMFKKYGIEVISLKRIKIGGLNLDENLLPGECRFLTENEVKLIKQSKIMCG